MGDVYFNKHGNPKPPWSEKAQADLKAQWSGAMWAGRPIASVPDTLDFISRRYSSNTPFFFIRFGDGEHKNIKNSGSLRKRGANLNAKRIKKGLEPFKEIDYLSDALRVELTEMMNQEEDDILVISSWNGNSPNRVKRYWNFYVFSCGLVYPEAFIPFLKDTFKDTKNLFVGPDYACEHGMLNRMFNTASTYELPINNSYCYLDDHYENIRELAKEHDGIVCASGLASKALGKRLYDDGINVGFLDIGSCADGITGLTSRRWISRMTRPEFPMQYEDLIAKYLEAFPE